MIDRAAYDVSIHATRVGGDQAVHVVQAVLVQFLSTPPVWVATDFVRYSVSEQ